MRLLVDRDRRPLRDIVREELRQLIQAGRFEPGGSLPAEPELARMLSVSRGTLREAIRALEMEGLLSHRRGVGTFLTRAPLLRNSLDTNFGVTQLIESVGLRPGIAWQDIRERPAGKLAAARLGIDARDPVIAVERVRTANGRRVIHSLDVIPHAIAPGRPEFVGNQSIYAYLRDECGQDVQYGIARLMPAIARKRVAGLLGVKPGTLLMVIDQVDYAVDGRAVLFSLENHLAEAFEFTVFRRGPGSGPGRTRRE
jgi:GntR family transcriptional regulator